VIFLKWVISQLRKTAGTDFQFEEQVDFSFLKELDQQILDISLINVSGSAEIDAEKVVTHLHITGELTLPCSRTLVEVPYPIDVKTTETIYLQSELANEDDLLATGDVIDLLPIVQEIILLEIPIQIFADEADKHESAPFSGAGWELILEETNEKKVDPRLAKLAELLDKKD